MTVLKKILVATDFSSNSSQAIDRGFLLAKTSGAQLAIVHAVGIETLAPLREWLGADLGTVSQKILDEAKDRLTEVVADSSMADGVPADLRVQEGSAGSVIPTLSESEGVDLVLLGAHGSGFLQRMLVGSTASRLLRKSKCPVLVVKEDAHKGYKRALIAVDFSPASETAIRLARQVAPDADLVLLHIFDVPFEGKMHYAGVSEDVIDEYRSEARARATQNLRKLAHTAGLTATDYSGIVINGDATRSIIENEEKYRCDLLVMGKHGTHVTEDLLLGSVTKRVLAESRCDVLVVIDKRHPDVVPITP